MSDAFGFPTKEEYEKCRRVAINMLDCLVAAGELWAEEEGNQGQIGVTRALSIATMVAADILAAAIDDSKPDLDDKLERGAQLIKEGILTLAKARIADDAAEAVEQSKTAVKH